MPPEREDDTDLTPASWLKFGQRNILYIGFVGLSLPLGLALDGPRPIGAQGLGGVAFALLLCGLVSAGFFALNVGLMVIGLARGRRIMKPLIGCVLPMVFGIGAMVVRGLVS